MKLKFAAAAVLAASSMSAMAADQTIVLDAAGTASFVGTNTLLDGGSDVLTFTGAAAGTYEILISFSGQYLSFDESATTLNGDNTGVWTITNGKKTLSFGSVEATASSPFVLNLAGILTDAKKANYSGEISISPVPEPSTYGMLLGGLGIMGFLARRKSKQA
jgi:hypothetical protein